MWSPSLAVPQIVRRAFPHQNWNKQPTLTFHSSSRCRGRFGLGSRLCTGSQRTQCKRASVAAAGDFCCSPPPLEGSEERGGDHLKMASPGSDLRSCHRQAPCWIPAAFTTTRSTQLRVYKSESHGHMRMSWDAVKVVQRPGRLHGVSNTPSISHNVFWIFKNTCNENNSI